MRVRTGLSERSYIIAQKNCLSVSATIIVTLALWLAYGSSAEYQPEPYHYL